MKSTRKVISVILTVLMLMSCVAVSFTVNASTGTLCDYYATNPNNKVGVQKTITIDGSASDWSEDMLIAQGAAWDVANHYKGGHENCVLDTYALFASWDNDNLYVGWQMVNTTDTWARSGDGPLSDGGRVLDVPLILALSVDPTSTSMSNKNTSGGSIWGQKMGLEFEQHVDHLLYMSGVPGNGDPAIFTAVDSEGNTDYSSGCKLFKSAGIEYKMATTNICSSIYGLNYSEDPSDVYDSGADWVDYKTFSGDAGTHSTTYDSFYEIKIPLSVLGIDANYIKNNGIGAMLVATRGESGLDCIPFDDTMLDNATGSYSNDASTSAEKDDIDVITSEFAKIGCSDGTQPTTTQPTTVAPTTVPATTVLATTAPVTTEPVSDTLTVNATSNLFSAKSLEASKDAKTVTVSFDLKSAMNVVNGQWTLKYDTSKLKLNSDSSTIMPYITDGVINEENGVIKGNFTNVSDLYDFTSEKALVQATFDIIGTGTTEVNLEVQELSVGYISGGVLNYKNAVVNGIEQNLSGVSGFTTSSISGTINVVTDQVATTAPVTTAPVTTVPVTTVPVTTAPVTTVPTTQPTTTPDADTLKVTATSNILTPVSKEYDDDDSTVTVTYKLQSAMYIVDGQWQLTYDSTKLSYDASKNSEGISPNIPGSLTNASLDGEILGDFSNLGLYDFTTEQDFVTVTFDIIGKGETTIDLNVEILGVAYLDDNMQPIIAYPIDGSEIKDISNITGFENNSISGEIVLSGSGDSEIMYGDVDGNGVINIKDSTLIQKHIALVETLTDEQLLRADVDHNGAVNITDASLIQKNIVKLVTSF